MEAGDVDRLSALRACMIAHVTDGRCRRLVFAAALGDECVPWHYSLDGARPSKAEFWFEGRDCVVKTNLAWIARGFEFECAALSRFPRGRSHAALWVGETPMNRRRRIVLEFRLLSLRSGQQLRHKPRPLERDRDRCSQHRDADALLDEMPTRSTCR
jgi:hypothetical protein